MKNIMMMMIMMLHLIWTLKSSNSRLVVAVEAVKRRGTEMEVMEEVGVVQAVAVRQLLQSNIQQQERQVRIIVGICITTTM